MPELTPLPPRRTPEFDGRDALDAAWARFRKATADLLREGLLSPDVLPALTPIVKEATTTLTRLTREAHKAAAGSKRRQKARGDREARLRRMLGRAAGQGSPAAERMLRGLDGEGPDGAA
ncbi:hypothetical protein AB0A91_13210 [Streptomyces sp. NPDC042207]|uniref:hypothetical protein n=1 Tax=Streptomyces sp. NPDC042207 TaxID=3154331 RepID=UPI0033CBA2C9